VINAFQWSKARLTLEKPSAMEPVQRFEANSKFFRSLVVILIVALLLDAVFGKWPIVVASALLLPLALWRFIDQRSKATTQAYWYLITLEGEKEGGYRRAQAASTNGCSHAGGVVFRERDDSEVEDLLVEASRSPGEWVLPKGHIEPWEDIKETAVREVLEETGVWARVRCDIDTVSFKVDDEQVTTRFYLMEPLAEREPSEPKRKHEWQTLDQALVRLKQESQELLGKAQNLICPKSA
jgi:ADP-ribose pyrophosphatase YjhB (NUDIX family)